MMAIATIAWAALVVFDYSVFADLIGDESIEVMVATLLGGLGAFDLAETYGLVMYPEV